MSFLSALLLISFGVCAPDSTLHVGIPAIPLVMDPMKADDTLSLGILSHIYETLYSFDSSTPSKKAIPQLAAALPSYSSDGTSAKIFIRSDARYSDGTPVRAQDFVDAVKRLQDLKSHPTALDLLDKLLVGVKAIDDLTLEFKLKGPQLKVEDVFSQLYTTPKAIGSGPFLQSLTKESAQILLIRNRHFHPEFYRERRLPFIDRILYHASSERETLLTQFSLGELDVIPAPDRFLLKRLLARQPQAYLSQGPKVRHSIVFNVGRSSPRAEAQFRCDLAHAIDAEGWEEALVESDATPAATLPKNSKKEKPSPYAGRVIKLIFPADSEINRRVSQFLKKSFSKLGVLTEFSFGDRGETEFDLTYSAWTDDTGNERRPAAPTSDCQIITGPVGAETVLVQPWVKQMPENWSTLNFKTVQVNKQRSSVPTALKDH